MSAPNTRPRMTVVGTTDDYRKESHSFMLEDLAKSGLVPEDMDCSADIENMEPKPERKRLITASYTIPFYDLNGEKLVAMVRRRRRLVYGADKLVGKYTQPHITNSGGFGHYPYLNPTIWTMQHGGVLHLCEGEKKTAAVIKLAKVVAIGLTGKDVAKETVAIIVEAVKRLGDITRICIWPDADVRRFDVMKSYGKLKDRLVGSLQDAGLTIEVIQPSWGSAWKGVDDALAGGWKFSIGQPVGEELPIGMRDLADQIGLHYTTGAKGDSFAVTINEDNINRILNHKPLWGDLWMNSDKGVWMNGSNALDLEIAPMEFTCRLQRVFDLPKVGREVVGSCMSYIMRHNQRSPWADWLSGLVWDGKPRLGGWLSRACGASADDPFVSEAGIKWMVSIVARTITPGCAVDWMLILFGPQGCGKSSLPVALLPDEFSNLQMLAPHAQDKDLQAAAGMCRILCFDEMATFFARADDQEFIKQFVTARNDTFRPPYGKVNIVVPRGSVLYGSTNKPESISADDSGYRRYVVIEVKGMVETEFEPQFDWLWLQENREQLWAEAVALNGKVDISQVTGAKSRSEKYAASPEYETEILRAIKQVQAFVRLHHFQEVELQNHIPNKALKDAFAGDNDGKELTERMLKPFWKYYGVSGVSRLRVCGESKSRIMSARLKKAVNES